MADQYQYDVLIIGSGASGLSLALQLAEYAGIAVLSKAALKEGATYYAQGGVSAVLDTQDSIESHVQDTLAVGAGLGQNLHDVSLLSGGSAYLPGMTNLLCMAGFLAAVNPSASKRTR